MIPYAIAGIKELASTTIALQNQINALIATSTLQASQGAIDLSAIAGDINLNGHSLLNIGPISGLNGAWSIDGEGNITAKSITAQAITAVGSASGVTVYDRATAAPKCIYIEGGVIKTSDGACGATQNTGAAAAIQPASASATIPGINQQVIDSGNQSNPVATSSIPGISTETATTTTPITQTATSTPSVSSALTATSSPEIAPATEIVVTATEPVIIPETSITTATTMP